MTNKETLEKKFEEIRERYHSVPLKSCSFSSEIPTAAISMKTFAVSVNPEFIEKSVSSGKIKEEDAIDAALEHEVGHFADHPYSIERVIAESIKAKEFDTNGESVRQFYDDVNNNLRAIARNPQSKIPNLYDSYCSMVSPTSLEKVLLKFYETMTGRNFGVGEIDGTLEDYVSKLQRINFLNATPAGRIEFVKLSERQNLVDMERFYSTLKPLFEEAKEQQENSPDGQGQTGEGSGSDSGNYSPKPSSPSPKDFDEKDLRKGLKKLVQEGIINREDVRGFVDEHGKEFQSGSLPGGSYNENPESFADRFFYESLAQKQRIKIKKTPLIRSDGYYPSSLDKFTSGDSINDFDPFSSMGTKIVPGVSNKWIKERVASHGQIERVPSLVLLMDDSGSMPNPKEYISYAVVSGLVIAREYIKNKASVSVGLFSDKTRMFDKSSDYNRVSENLRVYKDGSDTIIDLRRVPRNAGEDYVVITDGQIKNYDDVIDFLNNNANRAYIVSIGDSNPTKVEGRVKHMYVSDEKDIGKIVLDDIHSQNGGIKK